MKARQSIDYRASSAALALAADIITLVSFVVCNGNVGIICIFTIAPLTTFRR